MYDLSLRLQSSLSTLAIQQDAMADTNTDSSEEEIYNESDASDESMPSLASTYCSSVGSNEEEVERAEDGETSVFEEVN